MAPKVAPQKDIKRPREEAADADPQELAFWRRAVAHYKNLVTYGVCDARTKADETSGATMAIRRLGTSYVESLIEFDRKRKPGEERNPILVRHYAELGIDGPEPKEGDDEESESDFSDFEEDEEGEEVADVSD